MVDYERKVDEARAAGVEPPPITSLFQSNNQQNETKHNSQTQSIPGIDQLPSGMRKPTKWEEMTAHEREVEVQSYQAGIAHRQMYAEAAVPYIKEQDDARSRRRETLTRWLGGTVARWIT
jgi:hypothetical protein